MNLNFKEIKRWAVAAYDKLALFIILSGLLVSVVLLLVFLDHEKRELEAASWSRPVAAGRSAGAINLNDLFMAIEDTDQPFQVVQRPTRMMVAEVRTECVVCGRPIPFDAADCPYKNCGAPQPITPQVMASKDSDGDGMPDEWEKKYGLNPLLDDGLLDLDGDGFTNLEEYRYSTDPTDPTSFPPPVIKLKVLKIGRMPMPLSFQGVQQMTEDDFVFTVRNIRTHRDYYARMGEDVEGYKVVDFKRYFETVQKGNLSLQEDHSVLIMEKDGRQTKLTLGQGSGQGEPVAQVFYEMDKSTKLVRVGDYLKLKDISHKIIDIREDAVIVLNEISGVETSLSLQ